MEQLREKKYSFSVGLKSVVEIIFHSLYLIQNEFPSFDCE